MEIKKYQIGKSVYEFVCETWENSRNWGHRVTLLLNGCEINNHRVVYYNRTWESYRYQTCMKVCLEELMEERTAILKDNFKNEHDISRLTSKYEKEFSDYLKTDEELADYRALRDLI